MPIDVARDTEGVRMALEEIFEEDYARSRLRRELEAADDATAERMEARLPRRALAWGYYRHAEHLLRLDAEKRAGIALACHDLSAVEASGLVALDRARGAFESRHPACSSCGARQQNRFGVECHSCGAKFARKK